ncbi:unnamed protein product [Brassica rapa subsp. trilocularis]
MHIFSQFFFPNSQSERSLSGLRRLTSVREDAPSLFSFFVHRTLSLIDRKSYSVGDTNFLFFAAVMWLFGG